MAFKMKYKKGKGFPFKESPMKIAPALIAKLAPVAIEAMSKDKGAEQQSQESGQGEPQGIKKRGMEMWLNSKNKSE